MNHALRILMLHRAPDNTEADVVEEKLRSSGICFTSRRVTSGAAFRDELAAFSPDLILADYRPVREEGMAPLAVARHSAPHVPVIVLGDLHQHEEVARCVGGGATDYVLKDRLGRLVPSVQRLASEVRHRRTSLAALEKDVRAQRVRKLLSLPLALMDENDIGGILRRVAETAREVVSASGAAAFAGFSDGVFRHAMYSPPETALIIADSLPVIASTVRHQKRPLRIAGLYASTPSSDGDVRPSVLAAVPIIDRNGDVAGMISVWRDFGPFSREDETLLEQLAGIAALGLEALAKRQEAEDSRHEAAKNRRLLQCLLDNMPVAAAIAGSDGAISNISRYAAERHAITPHSSPHGGGAHLLHFRRLRGVGQPSVNELPHCRALRVNDALTDRWLLGDVSGGLVQVSCSAVPVRSDTGTAEGAVLLWEEVQPPTGVYPQGRRPDGLSCDRKQAAVEEVEQPEMRGLFRMVLDILPVGVWVVDKSGIPIVANAPATTMCSGTERHRQCHGLWSPAGKRVPRMKWPVVRALAGETVYAEVFEVDCCGTKKIIQMSSVPVRNATDIMGAIIVCADLTESKRTEEALKESEKKFRAIFEEAKSVICTLNCDRIVVDANPAAEVLFGWTRDNFGRINAADFFQNRECLDLMIENLAAEGSVKDVEAVMKRMDGHRLAVFISGVIVQRENGKTAGYRFIIHDMTERKELEQQLLQAQKMESVGLLAGGIAHDFNNLLTAISGYAQMIQEAVPAGDDHLQLCVTQVLAAAERAAALTGKLLAFGRKQVLNPRPVLINDVISNTGRFLNRIIGEDIEFVTCLTGKKLTVLADTGQIEQVLMNLAANARDAMPKGGRLQLTTQSVTIEPGTEKLYGLEDSGRYALISVSDTGVGMDDQTRGRIFEPFFTTKEVGKGTGLGLSIIYGILQQHHGSVTVSSAPGKGTTFNLYLPLAKAKVKDEKVVEYPLAEGGNETILVAEDEEIVRAYLKGVLENAGYRVITAENGEEALKKFRKHQRDVSLVVTDVVMPRKNGQELFDELAQLKPGLRVIFTSGYTDDILRFDGEGQAPWAFIGKPILKNDLLRKVRDSLDDPAVPDAAVAGG